jgi:hypothetical protein
MLLIVSSSQACLFYDSVHNSPHEAPLTVPSIQIQRSDMEKKLEEIGRDVLTLRQ